MPRLILFAGHAGTGKSTLAKKALPLILRRTGEPCFILDKDTVYGKFSSHVMGLLTGDPDDRDSPTYLEKIRDQEYGGLIEIVKENFLFGINVVLVGPFTREIMGGLFFTPEKLGLPAQTTCRIAWIELPADEARRRILQRADPRDQWKLDHWDNYLKRRVDPPAHPIIARYSNLHPEESAFGRLVDHVLS